MFITQNSYIDEHKYQKIYEVMMVDSYVSIKYRDAQEHFKPLYFVDLSPCKFVQANVLSCTLLPMYLIQNPCFQFPYSSLCRNLKVCLFERLEIIN